MIRLKSSEVLATDYDLSSEVQLVEQRSVAAVASFPTSKRGSSTNIPGSMISRAPLAEASGALLFRRPGSPLRRQRASVDETRTLEMDVAQTAKVRGVDRLANRYILRPGQTPKPETCWGGLIEALGGWRFAASIGFEFS